MLGTIRRLFRHKKKPENIWRPGRGYTVEVVGESHYQMELHRIVRRQGFWDNRRFELTEALVHQGYHFMLRLLGEASGVV